MSGYTRQYMDARSVSGMNGSVQRYEDTYRVVDAREAESLRSQRLADLRAQRPPFYIRREAVSTSREAMGQRMSDWDARFAAAGRN
ncbi:hypothetical protein V8E51_007482 [Hyaloscypha variabilis]